MRWTQIPRPIEFMDPKSVEIPDKVGSLLSHALLSQQVLMFILGDENRMSTPD